MSLSVQLPPRLRSLPGVTLCFPEPLSRQTLPLPGSGGTLLPPPPPGTGIFVQASPTAGRSPRQPRSRITGQGLLLLLPFCLHKSFRRRRGPAVSCPRRIVPAAPLCFPSRPGRRDEAGLPPPPPHPAAACHGGRAPAPGRREEGSGGGETRGRSRRQTERRTGGRRAPSGGEGPGQSGTTTAAVAAAAAAPASPPSPPSHVRERRRALLPHLTATAGARLFTWRHGVPLTPSPHVSGGSGSPAPSYCRLRYYRRNVRPGGRVNRTGPGRGSAGAPAQRPPGHMSGSARSAGGGGGRWGALFCRLPPRGGEEGGGVAGGRCSPPASRFQTVPRRALWDRSSSAGLKREGRGAGWGGGVAKRRREGREGT